MRVNEKQNLAPPRPVHPKAVRYHGLFGRAFLRQHMMIDEQWTPDSLTLEFKKMTSLLKKHSQFNCLEKKVEHKAMMSTYYSLQKQCREGRSHLKRLRAGNPQEVRNILKDHRHMQRLYQKMPLHLVKENINQRTFVMIKERDRLKSRLQQVKKIYEERLVERANVENRIKYENEFRLEEGALINNLKKQVQTSKTRLKAVMAINSTYKKIVQVLRYDEIFYVPILRSLHADVEDQSQFIKHILFLGSPALHRFKELGEQYMHLDERSRKTSRKSIMECAKYRKILLKPYSREAKPRGETHGKLSRYVRESKSMLALKAQFEEIEEIIKKIKIATISSEEKDIYSRIKSQVNNNFVLGSNIENDMLGHVIYESKMKCASVLKEVLINNMTEDLISRAERIDELKKAIKRQDEIQEKTLARIKGNSNLFVVLRFFLWNVSEIMRHVGYKKIPHLKYPVEYLKLPLLQYETLTMKVYPPEPFEEDIDKLLKEVQSKLTRLTRNFNWRVSANTMQDLRETYCHEMVDVADFDIPSVHDTRMNLQPEIDLIEEVRSYKAILNRNQIKSSSARLVQKHYKMLTE